LPRHNARFARPAALPEKAFVAADPTLLSETLCIEEERVVGRDNTVAYKSLRLQLPESSIRAHYVKARVRVREYPDGSLAVLHGPRCLCRYDHAGPTHGRDHVELGLVLDAVKAWPGSGGAGRSPGATASLDRISPRGLAQPMGRDEETGLKVEQRNEAESGLALTRPNGAGGCSASPRTAEPKSGQLMCYQNRTTSKATDTARGSIRLHVP
jgi:hypothetical protein